MRVSFFLVSALAVSAPVSASWFSSEKPEYAKWDKPQLQSWLENHGIETPSGFSQKELQQLVQANWHTTQAWSQEKYDDAQKVFANLREDLFDTWDESRLREFLVQQGVVAPPTAREKLVLAAKQQYNAYTNAAPSLSASASAAASTAIYGDSKYQASKSAASLASSASAASSTALAQVSETLARALDDSKDYVYSTWDDNQMRTYLEEKGVIQTKQQANRSQLLAYMRDAYAKATNPIWEAWSDSYMHEWLVSHGVIKSDFEKRRDDLSARMRKYYYGPQETVHSTWSESQLRQWLIDHDIIKSDAKLKKEKLQRLVADNYGSASDTVWSSWTDSDLKAWLIEHGYLRTGAQKSRDELIKLINEKNNDAQARTAAYLTWPDARLRAFLRNHNLPEEKLPTSRPGLLQETRIRYVQTSTRVEQIYAKLQALAASGVHTVEGTIGQILDVLSGAQKKAGNEYEDEKAWAKDKARRTAAEVEKQAGKVKNEL